MAVRKINRNNISVIAGSKLLVDIVHQQKLLSDDLYAQICGEYSSDVFLRSPKRTAN